MSDRLKLGAALAALCCLGMSSAALAAKSKDAPPAVDPNDACGVRSIGKKLSKPMSAAQDARNAKDWDGLLASTREADAVAVEKTEYEKLTIHEYQGIAFVGMGATKFADAIRELDATLNSPCMEEASKPARAKLLTQLAYQLKDYAKAVEYGNRSLQLGPDNDVSIYVGNAYYILGDYTNSRRMMTDVVTKLEANGKTPEEQTYRLLQSACINLKDNPCVVAQAEKLVTHYPKATYWQDLTGSLIRISSSDKELLNIYRLIDGVEVMKDPAEFTEMAQLAMAQGLPGEAQSIIEKGMQKGVFATARDKGGLAQRLLSESKQAVALDKSTLEKQDASASAKPTGDADVKLGAAYLSYGDAEKAIKVIERGISKGGVKDPDEAGLLLGIAYLRTSKKAEAAKAFHTVGKNPAMARLAKLWLLSAEGTAAAG